MPITRVRVNGARGYFIGGQHTVDLPDELRPRLAGNTLVWLHDAVTYRLETRLGREAALRLARTGVAASRRRGGRRRSRLRRDWRRLASTRRALAPALGFVGRRARGTSSACVRRARRRSSASSRLRAWLRASCATARTTGPQRAITRAFWASFKEGDGGDVEDGLHPRLGHVGVLAAGARRAARAQHDFAQRHGHVTRDPHRVIHAHYPV